MIVLTQSLVLADGLTPDHPVIGWQSVVTAGNIAASTAASGYPASNLANPSTAREWRGTAAAEFTLTVTPADPTAQLDYLAIARHNLGSARMLPVVEGFIGGVWTALAGPAYLPPDDRPVLWRWPAQALAAVRLRVGAAADGVTLPRIAVLSIGRLLVVQRRLYVGHTPLPLARRASISNGFSESGNFLGRVQLGGWRETTAAFRLLAPGWYRDNMDAFVAAAQTQPFFFAWRPHSYPLETGYAVLTDNVAPVPEDAGSGNLLAIALPMRGIT